MIINNFICCPECQTHDKMIPIDKDTTIKANVFCRRCKCYFKVVYENGKLISMIKEALI